MPPQRLTFRQIADDLEDRIRVGDYPVGARLPSYPELAELYSVSRATIALAVALLKDRGVAVGHSGLGVYVMRVPDKRKPPQLALSARRV
jgi:GntR family transcriptional regulator